MISKYLIYFPIVFLVYLLISQIVRFGEKSINSLVLKSTEELKNKMEQLNKKWDKKLFQEIQEGKKYLV
jgi:hypothetical protein